MAAAAAADGAAEERRSLDPHIWKACAGSAVRIPAVGSLVYYFPQGHAEQASGGADITASVHCGRPYSLCRVAGVQFLASRETDEVWAAMCLDPREADPAPAPAAEDPGPGGRGVVSFAKVLTPSDANNGGGFSVPRFCADSIFPPLDYGEDPPVQTLSVRDVHGVAWLFRHIYRGTPRRHLLTTGWSKFVNSKKLVAGDSVVFVRNGSRELFVGVRRTGRSGVPLEFAQCSSQIYRDAFSRGCRGRRVAPESIAEAVRLAGMDRPFEVTYYPRVGSSEFVVRKEVVEAALHASWSAGTRVKMAVEAEDASRMTWYPGTVSCIVRHRAPFTFSPWRTLEVAWDEPDVLQSIRRVSPWEVELLSASSQIPSPYPNIKKPRITQNQELRTDRADQNVYFPASRFSDMTTGGINSPTFSQNIFPAGMQGARHDLICVSGLFDFLPHGAHQTFPEQVNCNKILPNTNPVSTELDIESESKSEASSPTIPSSIHKCGSELFCNSTGSTPSKVINVSFQLFGKTIRMEPPVIIDDKEGCQDDRIAGRSFNLSLFNPRERLSDSYDGPPLKVLAGETGHLGHCI